MTQTPSLNETTPQSSIPSSQRSSNRPKRSVCDRCHVQKARCVKCPSGDRACVRCQHVGAWCTYSPLPTPSFASSSVNSGSRQRFRARRLAQARKGNDPGQGLNTKSVSWLDSVLCTPLEGDIRFPAQGDFECELVPRQVHFEDEVDGLDVSGGTGLVEMEKPMEIDDILSAVEEENLNFSWFPSPGAWADGSGVGRGSLDQVVQDGSMAVSTAVSTEVETANHEGSPGETLDQTAMVMKYDQDTTKDCMRRLFELHLSLYESCHAPTKIPGEIKPDQIIESSQTMISILQSLYWNSIRYFNIQKSAQESSPPVSRDSATALAMVSCYTQLIHFYSEFVKSLEQRNSADSETIESVFTPPSSSDLEVIMHAELALHLLSRVSRCVRMYLVLCMEIDELAHGDVEKDAGDDSRPLTGVTDNIESMLASLMEQEKYLRKTLNRLEQKYSQLGLGHPGLCP